MIKVTKLIKKHKVHDYPLMALSHIYSDVSPWIRLMPSNKKITIKIEIAEKK